VGAVDFAAQQRLEMDIQDQYDQLRSMNRSEADRVKKDSSSSWSQASAILSKAYSELTTTSEFEKFYDKWRGIIDSGKSIEYGSHPSDFRDPHFFDENAWLKLQKDDDNLKVVKNLQKQLNDLRLQTPAGLSMPYGWDEAKYPQLANFHSKSIENKR